ncbi:transposase [Streptomyces clavifer]|uniref:transposase n=1 Tax=Streptomyces clavifer TaxID=68188 RepID=UPI00365171B2
MKNYPPGFKADAVALYESRPEATIRSVAADLRIDPETLRNWVRDAGASRYRDAGRRNRPSTPPRWRRRTRPCGEWPRARERMRDPVEGGQVFRRRDLLVHFQCVADLQRCHGVKRRCSIPGSAARASAAGAGQPRTGPPGRRPTLAWLPGYGRCTWSRRAPTEPRGSHRGRRSPRVLTPAAPRHLGTSTIQS